MIITTINFHRPNLVSCSSLVVAVSLHLLQLYGFFLTNTPTLTTALIATPSNTTPKPSQKSTSTQLSTATTTNRRNYSDHSILKIAHQNLDQLAVESPDDGHQPSEADVLWLSNEQNVTYAYVGVANEHLRSKRSLVRSAAAQLMTDSLGSWFGDELYDDDYGPDGVESVLVAGFRLDKYHPLNEVYDYLSQLSKLTRVRVFDIGLSHERRPIKAVEIINAPEDRDFIWLDGCTHAREWITVSTAIYLIEQAIVAGVNKNFLIVPVVNVDGYDYTWTTDRMWRKNRRKYRSSGHLRTEMPERCNGVDLNRNWDVNFGGEGSSDNPCSYLYSGPGPFSEPEIRAVGDLIWNNRDRIKLFISLHSFNQLWACPFAYTKSPSQHRDHHMDVLNSVQNAVYSQDGVKYRVGPLSTSLYVGSGFAMDWVYQKLGIVNSYLVELRDTGQFGFLLPSGQIMPTATETWRGVMAVIEKVFGQNIFG